MNIEMLREYCLSLEGTEECFPFDEETIVFKVNGRIFVLANLDGELEVNLKCDPALAIELRERYPAIRPGYHMNKKHWNTVKTDGSVPDKIFLEWIEHSYLLVRSSKKN